MGRRGGPTQWADAVGRRGGLFLVVLPDYLLTCVAAACMRRPSLLLYGLAFLPIRVIDATALLRTLPMA